MKRSSLARGSSQLKRSGGPARKPMKRASKSLSRIRRKRRKPIPPWVRVEAYGRSKWCCIVCGAEVGLDYSLSEFSPHHVFPVRLYPELELEEDNLVMVCNPCHERHESAFRRIRKDELPACALALATDDPARQVFLDRTYTGPYPEAVAGDDKVSRSTP